jgi:hypothetical protein
MGGFFIQGCIYVATKSLGVILGDAEGVCPKGGVHDARPNDKTSESSAYIGIKAGGSG